MTEPNVLIGMLNVGDISEHFFDSYRSLQKPRLWAEQRVGRGPTHHGRNLIVNQVLRRGEDADAPDQPEAIRRLREVTHIFFIDDDMTFPADTLLRLLKRDVPVVSGFYTHRLSPFKPVPMRRVGPEGYTCLFNFCKGLQEVDVVGGGCLLVKREVFEAIEYPWFDYVDPAHRGQQITEDVPFCEKVQAAGFPILLDFDVQCGHLIRIPVGYKQWQQNRKLFDLEPEDPEQQKVMAAAKDVRPWRPAPKQSSRKKAN